MKTRKEIWDAYDAAIKPARVAYYEALKALDELEAK